MKLKLLTKIMCLVLLFGMTIGLFSGCNSIKSSDYIKPQFSSANLMQDAKIIKESLKKGEKPDAVNILSANKKAWTPTFINGRPDSESENTLNSTVEIQLKETYSFNIAVIEEIGNEVQYFRLQAWIDDSWKTVYQSEKIQSLRLCSFESVTSDKIRLSIDKFRSGKTAKIKTISLYNEPQRLAGDFNTTVYQRLDGDVPSEVLTRSDEEIATFARYYDVYNTVLIFDAVNWKNGEMVFSIDGGEEGFKRELEALKTIISKRSKKEREVKIICTALADGAGGDERNDVNTFMNEHWEYVADQMIVFMQKYDLDGLDIDWEYPNTKKDWKCYDKFMKKLDEGMERVKPGSILSAALSAWGLGMSSDTIKRIDQIQFMAYDGRDKDGYQSSLEQAQYGLVDLLNNGASLKQINIGIAAYGRPLNAGPYWASWRTATGDNLYWDNLRYNVDCSGQLGDFTYCSPALAGDKTAYSLLSGVGGVMVFRLACDKTMDDANSIARGIENALNRHVLNY